VETVKEYIRAGDVFQVVLSQRMSVPFRARPVDVYRALRALNPSPYMYFPRPRRHPGGRQLAGNPGPRAGRTGHRAPIAGTRPRGATPEEDLAMEAEAALRSEGARPST
jgi:anthranilate synthase component 1